MAEQEKTEWNKDSIKKEIFSWIKLIGFAVLFSFILNKGLIVNAQIPTGSMENTIMTHSKIIALRTSYLFSSPKRGDIAVFHFPDDETQLYIKRVIGLPGDTVEIIDGQVYINGSDTPLEEPYLKEEPYGSFGPYHVPENSYFMLGDNRNGSADSRFWIHTYVNEDKILGKAMLEYAPKMKFLK